MFLHIFAQKNYKKSDKTVKIVKIIKFLPDIPQYGIQNSKPTLFFVGFFVPG
jgi:hypothetical protein